MVDRVTGRDVLLLIDIQRDFCPGGALAVPEGDRIVPLANRLARHFTQVVLTQDWHPPGHASFASGHPGRRPFETVEFPYGKQTLWPDHCVQGSPGAAFHPDLATERARLVLRKGHHAAIDSYSAFVENDRTTPTGLAGYLRELGCDRVFLAGLALDYCVRFSAEDARRHGFAVVVLDDACRAIDLEGSRRAAEESFRRNGIETIASAALL